MKDHAITVYDKKEYDIYSKLEKLIKDKKIEESPDAEIDYSSLEKWWNKNYDCAPPIELNFEYLKQLHEKYKPKTSTRHLAQRKKLLNEVIEHLTMLSEELEIDFDPQYMDFSVIDIHELFQAYGKHSIQYHRKIWSLNFEDFRKDIWKRVNCEVKPGISAKRFPNTSLLLMQGFLEKFKKN